MKDNPNIVWAYCTHCMDREDHTVEGEFLICMSCNHKQRYVKPKILDYLEEGMVIT